MTTKFPSIPIPKDSGDSLYKSFLQARQVINLLTVNAQLPSTATLTKASQIFATPGHVKDAIGTINFGALTSAGSPGPAGPIGATGPAGPPGVGFPDAPNDGSTYGRNSNAWAVVSGSGGATGPPGPAGPTGPAGATGPAGPAGPTGATGTAGTAGATGPIGPTGLTGPAGPTGATGPAGPQGAPGPQGPPGTGTGGGIADAPSDGQLYARENAAWLIVPPINATNITAGLGYTPADAANQTIDMGMY